MARLTSSVLPLAALAVFGLSACFAPVLANQHALVAGGGGEGLVSPALMAANGSDFLWLLPVPAGAFLLALRRRGRLGFLLRAAAAAAGLGLAVLAAAHRPVNVASVPATDETGPARWAIHAPVPFGPSEGALGRRLLPPGGRHLLGTDRLGRDVLSGIIHGTRSSLLVGFGAVGLALLIGCAAGGFAGYRGGWVDALLGALIQWFTCFPALVLILAILAFVKPGSFSTILVLALLGWTTPARLLRGEVARLRGALWVDVAKTQGLRTSRIFLRRVLPHAAGPVIVHGVLAVASAILIESTLSYLGIATVDRASLGAMLRQGRDSLPSGTHLIIYPGAVLVVLVLALHRLGDLARVRDLPAGLREEYEPRT